MAGGINDILKNTLATQIDNTQKIANTIESKGGRVEAANQPLSLTSIDNGIKTIPLGSNETLDSFINYKTFPVLSTNEVLYKEAAYIPFYDSYASNENVGAWCFLVCNESANASRIIYTLDFETWKETAAFAGITGNYNNSQYGVFSGYNNILTVIGINTSTNVATGYSYYLSGTNPTLVVGTEPSSSYKTFKHFRPIGNGGAIYNSISGNNITYGYTADGSFLAQSSMSNMLTNNNVDLQYVKTYSFYNKEHVFSKNGANVVGTVQAKSGNSSSLIIPYPWANLSVTYTANGTGNSDVSTDTWQGEFATISTYASSEIGFSKIVVLPRKLQDGTNCFIRIIPSNNGTQTTTLYAVGNGIPLADGNWQPYGIDNIIYWFDMSGTNKPQRTIVSGNSYTNVTCADNLPSGTITQLLYHQPNITTPDSSIISIVNVAGQNYISKITLPAKEKNVLSGKTVATGSSIITGSTTTKKQEIIVPATQTSITFDFAPKFVFAYSVMMTTTQSNGGFLGCWSQSSSPVMGRGRESLYAAGMRHTTTTPSFFSSTTSRLTGNTLTHSLSNVGNNATYIKYVAIEEWENPLVPYTGYRMVETRLDDDGRYRYYWFNTGDMSTTDSLFYDGYADGLNHGLYGPNKFWWTNVGNSANGSSGTAPSTWSTRIYAENTQILYTTGRMTQQMNETGYALYIFSRYNDNGRATFGFSDAANGVINGVQINTLLSGCKMSGTTRWCGNYHTTNSSYVGSGTVTSSSFGSFQGDRSLRGMGPSTGAGVVSSQYSDTSPGYYYYVWPDGGVTSVTTRGHGSISTCSNARWGGYSEAPDGYLWSWISGGGGITGNCPDNYLLCTTPGFTNGNNIKVSDYPISGIFLALPGACYCKGTDGYIYEFEHAVGSPNITYVGRFIPKSNITPIYPYGSPTLFPSAYAEFK